MSTTAVRVPIIEAPPELAYPVPPTRAGFAVASCTCECGKEIEGAGINMREAAWDAVHNRAHCRTTHRRHQ